MKVKIYHNPRCSKSRQTLEILKNKNCDIEIIEYLKVPMVLKELKDVLSKLNYEPRDLIRKGEDIYKTENIIKFGEECGFNSCHIVTADGGFDFSLDFNKYSKAFSYLLLAFSILPLDSSFFAFFIKEAPLS